jgi:nucleotide-binding universal stress UspA family protein
MKIMVAVDFSDACAAVLAVAKNYARFLPAELWLIHVAPPDPEFVGYEPGPQYVRDRVAKEFHQEHQELQRHAAELRDAGVNATPLLVQGRTAEAILKEGERLGADLIIVGSHGHGAVYHMLVGSVTEGVLHRAKCPVLVVPTHGRT